MAVSSRPSNGPPWAISCTEPLGGSVSFTKTYEPGAARFAPVAYDGSLNADLTEIDGTWTIKRRMSGRFLMMRSRRPSEAVETEEKIAVPVE
jgi:hypothetical protein